MFIRKSLKILHTLGAAGMIGAFAGAILLIELAPQDIPADYVGMRQSVSLLADFVLLPSLAIVLIAGLLSMVAHTPYMNKGWALLKAAFGILMFKGTLHITGAIGAYAENVAAFVAAHDVLPADHVNHQFAYEAIMLWTLLALSIANVIVGVWRPKLNFQFFRGNDASAQEKSTDAAPAWTKKETS